MNHASFYPSVAAHSLLAAALTVCPGLHSQVPTKPAINPLAQQAQQTPTQTMPPQAMDEPNGPAPLMKRNAPTANATGVQMAPKSHLEDLGDLYVVRRRYVDAVNAYQQAAGDSPVIWNKLGVAYQHLFNVKAARESYQHSLTLNPKYAEAINNLGTILYSEKNYGAAEKCYVKALKLSPRSAIIYANLGTVRFARGDYKRGAKSYREAFRLDPAVFEADSANKIQEEGSREARAMLNFNLAKFYAGAGLNARALNCLRQALDDGFHDKKRIMEDEELAELRNTQEFRQLWTLQGMHDAAK